MPVRMQRVRQRARWAYSGLLTRHRLPRLRLRWLVRVTLEVRRLVLVRVRQDNLRCVEMREVEDAGEISRDRSSPRRDVGFDQTRIARKALLDEANQRRV